MNQLLMQNFLFERKFNLFFFCYNDFSCFMCSVKKDINIYDLQYWPSFFLLYCFMSGVQECIQMYEISPNFAICTSPLFLYLKFRTKTRIVHNCSMNQICSIRNIEDWIQTVWSQIDLRFINSNSFTSKMTVVLFVNI